MFVLKNSNDEFGYDLVNENGVAISLKRENIGTPDNENFQYKVEHYSRSVYPKLDEGEDAKSEALKLFRIYIEDVKERHYICNISDLEVINTINVKSIPIDVTDIAVFDVYDRSYTAYGPRTYNRGSWVMKEENIKGLAYGITFDTMSFDLYVYDDSEFGYLENRVEVRFAISNARQYTDRKYGGGDKARLKAFEKFKEFLSYAKNATTFMDFTNFTDDYNKVINSKGKFPKSESESE